ncbi:MAG TPA: DinB family protein [Methylomirabilota bacterium]
MSHVVTVTDAAEALARSGEALSGAAAAGRIGATALESAAAVRTIAAWTLAPAPGDPRAHVRAAHAEARPYLTRLLAHPADREAGSVMTADVFHRLTRRPGADTAPAAADSARYTYTPRKVLRRVLDHALDHLNQIDQWRTWRRDGIVPVPTDGWASSTVTLAEDRLPLDAADLAAWLWRIDQAIGLLAQRADGLGEEELDWRPPDGGWPLRRVVHHVSRCERLYATALDEAPPVDPVIRYERAARLLDQRLCEAQRRAGDPSIVLVNLYGVFYTPASAVQEVLDLESALLTELRGAAVR